MRMIFAASTVALLASTPAFAQLQQRNVALPRTIHQPANAQCQLADGSWHICAKLPSGLAARHIPGCKGQYGGTKVYFVGRAAPMTCSGPQRPHG
jgi:hypothetical protein